MAFVHPFDQVAAEGETYYRYGVMLKKVANFYNNMASQVPTVYRLLLLATSSVLQEAAGRWFRDVWPENAVADM